MATERTYKILSCDFETTVYDNQTYTEVWASAVVELNTEDVKVFHSIQETWEYFKSLKANLICYYHNLKFDGNFWLSYLMNDLKFEQATYTTGATVFDIEFYRSSQMKNNTFSYCISDMGQWYSITIKHDRHIIELRDSLKLLPFSLREIGKAFKTKHQKLEMEYKGFRYAGCEITDTEMEYIKNDVLVLKEALEMMYDKGHNKLTIGACCLSDFKKNIPKDEYEVLFPDVSEMYLDQHTYGNSNVDEYIRQSYKGGWCYLVKGKENKIFHNGVTADVNSLYPSMMHSMSGNYYPVGRPHFWVGNKIPDEATKFNRYYFIRIKTRFYLKPDKLPFIQVKHSWLYKSTEMLETSDVYNKRDDKYYRFIKNFDGEIVPTTVELTLTCTDYILFREHYNVEEFEIISGCWFNTEIGLFDDYINYWADIKMKSKGAMRTLAKLFLNNLYGKLASSKNSSFKYSYLKEDGSVGFYTILQENKKAGYIPIGSAITSYARNFTIRTAQANYHGKDKAGFIYADTDSIHCDIKPEELVNVPVHETQFCHWKLESYWDEAIFVRQKTYIEHITHEDQEKIDNPYYNIKCAGMPERCKNLFNLSMQGYKPKEGDNFNEEALEFLKTKRTIKDFKIGLVIKKNKLVPRRIKGGVLLTETDYELRW